MVCVDMQEATPAAASTAKPPEGSVGPETAEAAPVQERMWMRPNRT